MPTIQSASERERAAASSEANSDSGRRRPKASLIAFGVIEFSHRRLDCLLRPRLLVYVGEDQLALAPGVAGVDHELDVVAHEQPLDRGHLPLRALVADHELEAVGHDRQIGHAPLLEARVVLVGVGELHQVPHRPGHDVLRTLEIALVLLKRARQHLGQVAPDGRLLRDHKCLRHEPREGSAGANGTGRTGQTRQGRRPRTILATRCRWGQQSRQSRPAGRTLASYARSLCARVMHAHYARPHARPLRTARARPQTRAARHKDPSPRARPCPHRPSPRLGRRQLRPHQPIGDRKAAVRPSVRDRRENRREHPPRGADHRPTRVTGPHQPTQLRHRAAAPAPARRRCRSRRRASARRAPAGR